jgi:PAS domain S-box-containing protein
VVSEDLVQCGRRALDWLVEHAGVSRAVCAAVDPDLTRLVGLVGRGVSPAAVARFVVDLASPEHPLVRVLDEGQPVIFPAAGEGRTRPTTPLGALRFLAVPLHGRVGDEEVPAGILLVSPVSAATMREASWLARVLGHRLVRPRFYGRLVRERSLLHGIINAVPDAILLTDSENRIAIANTRAEALLASRESESEGRRRAVALNNMLFSSALGQRALGDVEPERRELALADPAEGTDLLFELMSTPTGDTREGSGVVSILRNVTDLRRATEEIQANYRKLRLAETEVRAERDRLDLIIDSVADPIIVTDPAGNIVLMNTPAERLYTAAPGASPEEVGRVRANDANFTSFVSNLFFGVAETRYRGGISLVDPKTGLPVPVEALSGKIFSEHGEVTAIVTILHDRTEALELERLYEELKQASELLEERVRAATAELVRQNELLRRQAIELEQASALKTQFLANMSHEFRTPLNAILGYTSMLLKGVAGQLTPLQHDNLTRVDSNSRHLLAIINDILDISRIEAGRMPLHLTEFKLPELIAEVVAELEPIITRAKLDVVADVPASLPAMRSDRPKVKQIVLNLLTNALKFTPHGHVKVSARALPDSREIAIAVVDTGIGIDPSDQAKIFEDFQQADNSSTRQYGGAGLGLAICRRLAGMLEGQITVQSRLGVGSTFTLTLPLRPRRR